MNLSSNSIIHFTESKENLKGILTNNFKVQYCKESIVLGGIPNEFYVPMVSFCDIPLSNVKDHIEKYGDYGIGLTKEWAEKGGLNPVLYIEQNSTLSNSLLSVFNKVLEDGDIEEWTEHQNQVGDIVRYLKNYQHDLIRQGIEFPDYRFSDEREWRYVPSFEERCFMMVSEDYYNKNKKKLKLKMDQLKLSFSPNDIKYIIIKNDNEISEFINLLRKAKGKKYSYHDVERLTTRILTTEQIKSDI